MAGIPTTVANVSNLVSSAATGVSTLGNLASAASSVDGIASAARLASSGLPAAGEAIGDFTSAIAAFTSDADPNDWRVRLSLSTWSSFQNSPVLAPLKSAGGLIFPYTPQITMQSSAKYGSVSPTQTNYLFHYFQNSDPGSISITAPMHVEDSTQALYWIAAVHYLRSLTKMFAGSDPKAGNPPPIVFLSGYGNYVFHNVPVVITKFSCDLMNDCDYIQTNVVGSAAGQIQGIADSVTGLSGAVGQIFPSINGTLNAINDIAGIVGQVAALAGQFGVGGSVSGGSAYVPTKSTIKVELTPMYSRNSVKNFSLDRFVEGGYLNNPFSYI